jgi:hypothetical protein
MTREDDIRYIRSLLEAHYRPDSARDEAPEEPDDDYGVPPEMQIGTPDEEGLVQWRITPSPLTDQDISDLEARFNVAFPNFFRAYLLAACHLFDQVCSRRFDQKILMMPVPSNNPTGALESLMSSWQPLIAASFVPFAEWGDSWGPMCFDALQRSNDDCPIVWMDHDILITLGEEACSDRNVVAPHVQPLYSGARDFIEDVFGTT